VRAETSNQIRLNFIEAVWRSVKLSAIPPLPREQTLNVIQLVLRVMNDCNFEEVKAILKTTNPKADREDWIERALDNYRLGQINGKSVNEEIDRI
jgi:hypothetical protein